MIRQEFILPRYDWHVSVYYSVTTYWTREIMDELRRVGCRGESLRRAYRNLESGNLNTGITYSNFGRCDTVMVISRNLRNRPVRRRSRLSGGDDSAEDVSGGEEVYL